MSATISPEYNEYILSTCYHSGWITLEQYHAATAALQAMPHLTAIDFLLEQTIISPGQAEGLRQSIYESMNQQAAPAPEPEAAPADDAQAPPPVPRIVEAHAPRIVSTPEPVSSVHIDRNSTSEFPDGLHIEELLRLGVEAGASDVHIGVSMPALMRRYGTLQPLYHDGVVLTERHTEALIKTFLNEQQQQILQEKQGVDFSYEVPGMARCRASVVRQRKGYDAVFRIVDTNVRTMDELGLPEHLKILTQYQNGLVLVTGAVGSGKSTTLAAMVQEINTHRKDHIITLEDPIEYVFRPAGCQITQREVHTHTMSFAAALRASLREDPDVIIVGEMRDLETISLAITASETGHLVIATLHTTNASRTLDRVLDAFPVEQQGQIRTMVAESLRGVISQQLVPKADGSGRIAALEIMVNTPAVAALIRDSKTFMLPGQIQIGKKLGMKLMDDSLMELAMQGIISPREAYDRAEQKKPFEDLIE